MKRGPGRPKVKPANKCSELVSVRFTPAERRDLAKQAKASHIGLSAFIRSRLWK